MKKVARIELQYLPSLEYFCALLLFDGIQIEAKEHYVKQSFRNRCYINTSQGTQMLIVPVCEKHGKVSIEDVKIDDRQKWKNNHWRSIESAYRNAPYFEHYGEELKQILYHPHERLLTLNHALLSFCLRAIRIEIEITTTDAYEKVLSDLIYDLRDKIIPKASPTTRTFYQAAPYQQVFGNEFVSNLSILDLLFCEGPNSIHVLRASQPK